MAFKFCYTGNKEEALSRNFVLVLLFNSFYNEKWQKPKLIVYGEGHTMCDLRLSWAASDKLTVPGCRESMIVRNVLAVASSAWVCLSENGKESV